VLTDTLREGTGRSNVAVLRPSFITHVPYFQVSKMNAFGTYHHQQQQHNPEATTYKNAQYMR
jgi:hypothetical protein